MAKRRTRQQKIKAQQKIAIQPTFLASAASESDSPFTFKKSDLKPAVATAKLEVADLLMSQPAEIKSDLLKTLLVTIICLIGLAIWYWRIKIA